MNIILSENERKFLFAQGARVDKAEEMILCLPVMIKKHHTPVGVYENLTNPVDNANLYIKSTVVEIGKVSDGYHTFDELYEHRILNFILVCKTLNVDEYAPVWKSKKHSDESEWDGWFIMGINSEPGEQISYHLPIKYWDKTAFATEYDKAPPFDGHTSADVLVRLEKLLEEL